MRAVKYLLQVSGIDVSAPDNRDMTALHIAARNGSYEMVNLILTKARHEGNSNVVVNKQNSMGMTPIMCALRNSGNLAVVRMFALDPVHDISMTDAQGRGVLHWAVYSQSVECVRTIAGNSEVDVNLTCNDGYTPLQRAIESNDLHIVKFLLGHPDIDVAVTVQGQTLLHVAADAGRLTILKYLLRSCDIDVNATDFRGQTPLHKAASFRNHTHVAAYLISLKSQTSIDRQDVFGETALHMAVGCDGIAIASNLMRGKFSVLSLRTVIL